ARQHLRSDPVDSTVPLIYPAHFESGFVRWPKHGKKPNAIVHTAETANLLVPSSRYVLVKRFSAKEERRRIVAAVYDDARLPPFDAVGFENHLNYFHRNGGGLEADLSRGLAAFLNSSRVDQFFRQFSGHTQVNAKDLRKLRYPALTTLRELGSRIDAVFPAQSDLDYVIEQVLA
ncbi:MAG: adenine methyltransferase, partial [Longimicrobiales bacterium]